MGLAPPRPPPQGTFVSAVVRVLASDPAVSTWNHPALVTLAVHEVLHPVGGTATLPAELRLSFGPPGDFGQQQFYIVRFNPPDQAEQLARLGAQQVPLPPIGATVIVWLEEVGPGEWRLPPHKWPGWIADDAQVRERLRQGLGPDAPPPSSLWARLLRRLGLA